MRWHGLLLWSMLGCTNEADLQGKPPPEGIPKLSSQYTVTVELLATDCTPGGLIPSAAPAKADVFQDGVRIEWRQRSTAEGGDFWYLTGSVCAPAGDPFVVRLKGGRSDTVSGCQTQFKIPTTPSVSKVDPCDDGGRLDFEMDECGVLHTETEARLSFAKACAFRAPCTLSLRMIATPKTAPMGAPERCLDQPPR